MSVLHEEDPEQTAARLADEAADRQLAERVRETVARADAERRKEIRRISEAMDLIEHADPMLLGEVRAQRNIRGSRLVEQRVSAPSLGGQTPANMELLQRQEASREQGWRNEQAARERWVDDQEEVIRGLCAGQTEDNQRQIRAQFAAQKARG